LENKGGRGDGNATTDLLSLDIITCWQQLAALLFALVTAKPDIDHFRPRLIRRHLDLKRLGRPLKLKAS